METQTLTTNATQHTEPPISRQLLRRMGYEMYMDGRPLSDCLTTPEREGWRKALEAEAETATPNYAESMGF